MLSFFPFPPHCLFPPWSGAAVCSVGGTRGVTCRASWAGGQRDNTYEHQGLPLERGEPNNFLVGNDIQLVKN